MGRRKHLPRFHSQPSLDSFPQYHAPLPDWRCMVPIAQKSGGKPQYVVKNHTYNTYGEYLLAKFLHQRGIPFTPEVMFQMRLTNGRIRGHSPDFFFNYGEFVWQSASESRIIHGIEAKGTKGTADGTLSKKALELAETLERQFGVVILLLSERQIRYYTQPGRVTLRRYKR